MLREISRAVTLDWLWRHQSPASPAEVPTEVDASVMMRGGAERSGDTRGLDDENNWVWKELNISETGMNVN